MTALTLREVRKIMAGTKDLTEQDLSGINLKKDLHEVDLTQAQYDDQTFWPERFDPQQAGAVKQV